MHDSIYTEHLLKASMRVLLFVYVEIKHSQQFNKIYLLTLIGKLRSSEKKTTKNILIRMNIIECQYEICIKVYKCFQWFSSHKLIRSVPFSFRIFIFYPEKSSNMTLKTNKHACETIFFQFIYFVRWIVSYHTLFCLSLGFKYNLNIICLNFI